MQNSYPDATAPAMQLQQPAMQVPQVFALMQERMSIEHLRPQIPNTLALLDQTINGMMAMQQQMMAAMPEGAAAMMPGLMPLGAPGMPPPPPPAPPTNVAAVGATTIQELGTVEGSSLGKTSGKGRGGSHRWNVPTENHPGFNLTGRIVGPRGTTLQGLQQTYKVRLFVRGVGSERPGAPKRARTGDSVNEDVLHVNIEGGEDGDVDGCIAALEELCAPVTDRSKDIIKQRQLNSVGGAATYAGNAAQGPMPDMYHM